MNGRNMFDPQERSFTLVELLTVIAIVAVLTSLLMPALSRARTIARTIGCSGNLKQQGNAMVMYQNDYDSYYPPSYDGNMRVWSWGMLSDYMGYKSGTTSTVKPLRQGVFNCPADNFDYVTFLQINPASWTIFEPSCGFNVNLSAKRIAQIKNHNPLVIIGDSGHRSEDGAAAYTLVWGSADQRLWPRHAATANVLWFDGSVSAQKNTSSFSTKDSKYWTLSGL